MGAGNLSLQVYLVYTHYLYYYRPRQHMTVPRKLPTNTREERYTIYRLGHIAEDTLNVGTVHKPRQGGINSVPL